MIRLNLPKSYPHRVEAKDLQFVPADAHLGGNLPRTHYHYSRDVREGLDSNVIMAPVMWVMRTFTEAQAVVESLTNEIWRKVKDEGSGGYKLAERIDRPNNFYDGDTLWKATCISYTLDGNAYWRKVRNRIGDVVQLWYVPHWMVQPKWPEDRTEFISHYELGLGGPPERVEVRDMIHFRFGLDPRNTRLGLAPLKCLVREVFTDDEAANFSAKILGNMGVPGMVVSPKDASSGSPSDQDIEKLKTGFSGDNRGGTVVLKRPTDVHQYGFNPQMLTLGDIRDVTEERVCAVIGIPAAIVGFGSGMQATKVGATMRELVRMAWVGCLTPMQHSLGRQLTAQLLPDYVAQTRRFRVRFDTSEVSGFEEDEAALVGKITNMVQQGVLRVDRAQEMLGLEVDSTQEIYLRPSNSLPVDKYGKPIEAAKPAGAVDQRSEDEEIPAAVANRMNGSNGKKPDEED